MLHCNRSFMTRRYPKRPFPFEESTAIPPMSQQVSFSATVCVLTMALFAITSTLSVQPSQADKSAQQALLFDRISQR